MNIESIFEEYGFLPAEREFIRSARIDATADINQSRVLSEFVLGRRIERATKRIIDSNERLAESTDRHAKAMRRLTAALVAVGVIQVIVLTFQVLRSG